MSTLEQVADAIRDTLAAVDGLSVFDAPPESLHPPAAVVMPPDIDYRQSFGSGGVGRAEIEVLVLTAPAGSFTDAAFRLLWPYMDASGTKSIFALIEADQTLGGIVEAATVKTFRMMSSEEVAGIGYVGGTFTISLMWRSS